MKHEEMIILLAKTGLLFANCDGEYHANEHAFIVNYIKTLQENSILSDNIEKILMELLNKKITLEKVLSDTNHLLKDFNITEQNAIVNNLYTFILNVIDADNRRDPKEQEYLKQWCAYFPTIIKD